MYQSLVKTAIWAVALVCAALILANGGAVAQRDMVPIGEPDPGPAPTLVQEEPSETPVIAEHFPASQTADARGFPHIVTVEGTVDVGNFPATQNVAGAVDVSNLPLDEDGNLRVSSAAEPRIPIRASDFPVTIDSSGSYYLVEDVVVHGDGIVIEASYVTIDLMGFTIDATSARTPAIVGGYNVTVENGTLIGPDGQGNESTVALGAYATVRDVMIESPYKYRHGISVGQWSLIQRCQVTSTSVCIRTGRGSVVEDTVVFGSGDESYGMSVTGSIVRGCTVVGATGITARDGSRVSNCVINAGSEGVIVSSGSVIADSFVSGNKRGIIVADRNSIVKGCRVDVGGEGIQVFGDNSTVIGNEVMGDPGIMVLGNRNRIERNRFGWNLTVDGIDNVVVKNTSCGSFDIAAGNIFGPIVNVAGGGDLADFPDSDHPQANFEY